MSFTQLSIPCYTYFKQFIKTSFEKKKLIHMLKNSKTDESEIQFFLGQIQGVSHPHYGKGEAKVHWDSIAPI